jgi:hypothetical protein
MDHRLPSLTDGKKSEELPSTVGHQRMFKLTPVSQFAFKKM